MSLRVTLSVNGTTIDDVEIVNRGPANPNYDEGDHPGGPGRRIYQWRTLDGRRSGTVLHARGDGAHALAALVFERMLTSAGHDPRTPDDTPPDEDDVMDSRSNE